jgi:hypothetical protein
MIHGGAGEEKVDGGVLSAGDDCFFAFEFIASFVFY